MQIDANEDEPIYYEDDETEGMPDKYFTGYVPFTKEEEYTLIFPAASGHFWDCGETTPWMF